ncbi:Protein of unknown function (DUF2971) [Gulbenkiania indica]|uniref:DUF2971 domain-containing protein n=1 Tax=Gulbenkiania indica TaxID=375574 RepID=A0A0K6GV00_9NEIS|nr:DUF2971 domain-containing protein [Gulbenkiania indica]CUA82423.1 Protein of unknown function (DUF2971) [Gulbenkiania indica]
MPLDIVKTYPTLWHYTTATGLDGILSSGELWATNIRYLNDEEEMNGFFKHKFPVLLEDAVDRGIAQVIETPRGQAMLEHTGSVEGIKREFLHGFNTSLIQVTLALEVYVTSFCYAPPGVESVNGLLSQWRGYGIDGGYAIIFDTQKLFELCEKEQEKYKHAFMNFSDVDYHQADWQTNSHRHEETIEWEQSVRKVISDVVVEGDLQTKAEQLFVPIVAQAVRHKHVGFQEEREVRIATVRLPKKLLTDAANMGMDIPPPKKVSFYNRSGLPVPYISLFDGIPREEKTPLPIKEIVVGPHRDKVRRKQSVEMLLEEIGLDVPVRVSEIPYLGR